MSLLNITLNNFRLHKNSSFDFCQGLNFIVGKNGTGKTSILEAIYYLCVSKSFYNVSDEEIANFESDYFDIKGIFNSDGKKKIRVFYSKAQNKKAIFKDDKNISKASEIIGLNPIVIFTPEDYKLTYGYSQDRRKFVDSFISQYSASYLETLLIYNKILKNRKALLEKIKNENNKSFRLELDAWSEKLFQTGSFISYKRLDFFKEFIPYLNKAYRFFSDDKEEPDIFYYSLDMTQERFYNLFKDNYKKYKEEEINKKSNLIGPHRDDFIFKINNYEIKKYGSEGQNKTFQAALKFAQYFFLKDKLKKDPLLLLDDPFAALDEYRSSKISEFLQNIKQSFIATVDVKFAVDMKRKLNGKIISL